MLFGGLIRTPFDEMVGEKEKEKEKKVPFGEEQKARKPDKEHREVTVVPYPREHVYAVVADVDAYKEFIPWCKDSRVMAASFERPEGVSDSAVLRDAELVIGFPGFSESYVSHLVLDQPGSIEVLAQRGLLFNHLVTSWEFDVQDDDPDSTLVSFALSFDFQSALHRRAADFFFSTVADTMVKAFAERCRVLADQGDLRAAESVSPKHPSSPPKSRRSVLPPKSKQT